VKTNRNAFTLVELLVTIVILAVLGGIVVTATVDTVSTKAEINSREIKSAIRYAKVFALSQRRVHRIIFDSSSNAVRVEDENGSVAWNPVTYSPYEWTLAHGEIDSVDFDGNNFLEFGTSGEGQSGGSFEVAYNGLTQTYTVSPITGRVALEEVRN